jgi:hypothetical protein
LVVDAAASVAHFFNHLGPRIFFWLLRCLPTASGFIVRLHLILRRQVMVTATAAAAAVHSAATPLWDTCNIFTSNTSSDQFIASTTIS